jgi:hypothetical protein
MDEVVESDILRHGAFEYIRIHDYSNYTLELFMAYDSVIIESNNRDFVEKLVRGHINYYGD